MPNKNLTAAKKAKNDEFFTQIEDIKKEVENYKEHLKNKTIYCNCDDYRFSNFYLYFKDNFKDLGLKKLITTNYDLGNCSYKCEYDGISESIYQLNGNGDFQSNECIEILKQADVVVTNPPFSLFRAYAKQLMDYGKKFLIIGSENAITYKEIFPYIKNNGLWLGVNHIHNFIHNGEIKKFGNICWFTNIENPRRNTPLDLYKKYNEKDFPKYDNYNAIEVSKTCEIPEDYDGVMGVPISFLDKYCPNQFEILALMAGAKGDCMVNGNDGKAKFYLNNKGIYARILIKPIFE